MEEELRRYDYSHELDKSRLIVQGDIYNLKEMMGEINREYFSNDLTLQITWFGKKYQHNRSQVTFGLYHEPLKLIKINRFLDNKKVPDYLVNYVIYHEMLHHVCPSYYDEDGRHKIHNKEFKKRETDFRFFSKAQDWIKKNKERLFRGI
jgi:hypothetical protein